MPVAVDDMTSDVCVCVCMHACVGVRTCVYACVCAHIFLLRHTSLAMEMDCGNCVNVKL